MSFTKSDYHAILRLRSNDDFRQFVEALERRLNDARIDFDNTDPDKPGKVGQLQGKCRELADILESIAGAEKVAGRMR